MNCLIIDDEGMARAALKRLCAKVDEIQLVETCSNALDGLKMLKSGVFDLLFLDIEMPEVSGLDLLESLENKPKVIITSSKTDYAFQAFEFQVDDFLAKPISFGRFMKAIDKINKKNVTVPDVPDHIFVKTDGKRVKVNFADIMYLEAMKDYVIVKIPTGRLVVHTTLKKFRAHLAIDDRFMQVHRSYIVNIDQITNIADNCVILGDNAVPVSRSYQGALSERINSI